MTSDPIHPQIHVETPTPCAPHHAVTALAAGEEARPAAFVARSPRIDAEARRRIGRNLRVLYADILNQPLPERFEALLAALAAPAVRKVS